MKIVPEKTRWSRKLQGGKIIKLNSRETLNFYLIILNNPLIWLSPGGEVKQRPPFKEGLLNSPDSPVEFEVDSPALFWGCSMPRCYQCGPISCGSHAIVSAIQTHEPGHRFGPRFPALPIRRFPLGERPVGQFNQLI